MIAIIDYGAGNLRSVQKAFEKLGCAARITFDPDEILSAGSVVLPGVGSFGDSMNSLNKRGLSETISKSVRQGKPFLGICLGLQLLFETSEESPDIGGMGMFRGEIVEIPALSGFKVPHMGWNSIDYDERCPLFEGIGKSPYVYFVHSYYMKPKDKEIITALCEYSITLPIALQSGNVFAVQFHPEKSGAAGLKMLENFARLGGEI